MQEAHLATSASAGSSFQMRLQTVFFPQGIDPGKVRQIHGILWDRQKSIAMPERQEKFDKSPDRYTVKTK